MSWFQKEGANGQPIFILKMLRKTTFNSLWTMVTGEKISLGDSRFVDLMEDYVEALQNCVKAGLPFLPWLKYCAPERSGYNWIAKASADTKEHITEYFERHQRTFTAGSNRDLIDAYLERVRREKDPGSSFYGEDVLKHAIGTVTGLFLAGGETTSNILTWLIFYLCCDQDAQRTLQEEIDRVIGMDREPTLKDKLSMPYTEAVILETLRKSSLVPVGIIHQLTEDTHFQNYHLEKGTVLIANLYHAHYNPVTWGDPEAFRPERFLSADKGLSENVVAFQVGKRQCLGEVLARDVMFLFVAKLFQKFHFNPDANIRRTEYLEPNMGIILTTKHVPVVVVPRMSQK